jgi:hypothetical protein
MMFHIDHGTMVSIVDGMSMVVSDSLLISDEDGDGHNNRYGQDFCRDS